MQDKQQPLPENTNPRKRKGETISELAHRHLRDEKHTTTDEELRNATVELSDTVEAQDKSLYEVDNSTILPSGSDDLGANNEGKTGGENDSPLPNPYSVLSK